MQVSSSTFSSLPVPISRRDQLFDRRQAEQRQRDVVAEATPATQSAYGSGEVTRIRARPSIAAQSADNQLPAFSDNLPSRARNAVAAYSNNGPSIEERLGVDLVGVDLYV